MPFPKTKLTPFQTLLVELIRKRALNGSISTTELADRAKSNRLAVWSSMCSLEARGLACCWRHGDEWAASMWALKGELSSTKQL